MAADDALYLGIHHSSLLVADTQRALAFYRDVLGLPENSQRPATMAFPGAWLDVSPGQQIHLLELPNPDPSTGRPSHGGRDRHTTLRIRSIAALQQRLDAAAVPYTLSQSGRTALFCRDPDGNALEFIQA